jgi:hypothetical protein
MGHLTGKTVAIQMELSTSQWPKPSFAVYPHLLSNIVLQLSSISDSQQLSRRTRSLLIQMPNCAAIVHSWVHCHLRVARPWTVYDRIRHVYFFLYYQLGMYWVYFQSGNSIILRK